MDIIIIKKDDTIVQKNIGRFFRKVNFMKYISPDDKSDSDVFIDTYNEVLIHMECYDYGDAGFGDVTLSIHQDDFPKVMVNELKLLGYSFDKTDEGIYMVKGNNVFPIQITVGQELPLTENPWLKLLTKNADKKLVNYSLNEWIKLTETDKSSINVVFQICAKANREVFLELYEDLQRNIDSSENLIKCNFIKECLKS